MSSTIITQVGHFDEEGQILFTLPTPWFQFKKRILAKATKEGFYSVFVVQGLNPEEVTLEKMQRAQRRAEREDADRHDEAKFRETRKDYVAWLEKCRKAKIFLEECIAPSIRIVFPTVANSQMAGEI